MRRAHTVEQVRTAEAEAMAGRPEGELMQRAAAGLARAVASFLGRVYGARVLLLVGSGDNGGDALWAGAQLARRGAQVEAIALGSRIHEAGLAALRTAGGRLVDPGSAHTPDLLVDGIVGIGGSGGLRPEAAAVLVRYHETPIVAVDIPSGVDVDTGELAGDHVTADLTVTFGTYKPAHLVQPAAQCCGAVELVDIGLHLPESPVEALQDADVAALLPWPDTAGHKYSRGVVGLRTGSARYPGAAVLTAAGAAPLAGMVRYVGDAADSVRAARPEVVVGEGRVQAWVVGSGGDDAAESGLAAALADDVPLVVDAEALRHLVARPTALRGRPAVLTPHAGELAALLTSLGESTDRAAVEAGQLAAARRAAELTGAVVVLKGPHTLVAEPGGRVRVNTSGVPWLATAGSGDVLAGIVGALLATGVRPWDAAAAAAYLHGAAGALASAGGPIVAADIADAVGVVVAGLAPR